MDRIRDEKLEVLAGERGNPARHAVRKGDLARLPELRSKEVSAAPTADDFNALRRDLEALRQAIVSIGQSGAGRR